MDVYLEDVFNKVSVLNRARENWDLKNEKGVVGSIHTYSRLSKIGIWILTSWKENSKSC